MHAREETTLGKRFPLPRERASDKLLEELMGLTIRSRSVQRLVTRIADHADGDAICRVHRAAVANTCAEAYPCDTVRLWLSHLQPDVYETVLETRFVVIAELSGLILGFAQWSDETGVIEALYVLPGYERRGIGSRLLAEVEAHAAAERFKVAKLRSTLNAEKFYEHQGYRRVGAASHRLSETVHIPCIKMEKPLLSRS